MCSEINTKYQCEASKWAVRNPYLANALEIIGQAENRYSGIPTIRRAMEEAGLEPPKFESTRGIFRVTLYNTLKKIIVPLTELQQRILEFCKVPKNRSELENEFKNELTGAYLMTRYIYPMVKEGLLTLTIPDKPKSKNQRFVRKSWFPSNPWGLRLINILTYYKRALFYRRPFHTPSLKPNFWRAQASI